MTLDRKIKWLFGLIVLANVVIVLVVALGAFEPPPPKPLPNPNGYDDFVKAGKMLSYPTKDFYTTNDYRWMTQQDLISFVATNATALKLTRIGLGHECRVPDDYSRDYGEQSNLTVIRALAQNLCAEGRLAKMQNRTNDATQSYLDAISFSVKSSQGGLIISKLIGVGLEELGRSGLRTLINDLRPQECRKIAQTFETLEAADEPVENVLKQEKLFARKALPPLDRLAYLVEFKRIRKEQNDCIKNFQTNQLLRREMMIDFAARAYQLEKGKPPATVSDLVPDYLKAVPKNPVTGSNLVLRALIK